MADEQSADRPRKARKSVTPPASSPRVRKAAPAKRAAPARKSAPATKSSAPRKAVPAKKTAAKKTAAPKKAAAKQTAAKKTAAKKTAATTTTMAEAVGVAKKAVKARTAATKTTGTTKAVTKKTVTKKAVTKNDGGATKAPRASKRSSGDLVAGVSVDAAEVVAPPDAPLPAGTDIETPPPSPPDDDTTTQATPPPPAAPGPRTPAAKGALVLAILALVVCWLSVFSLVFALVILVAIVAVIVAVRARRAGLRLATAALVVALIALIAGIGTAAVKAWNERGSGGVKYSKLVPGDCLKKPGVAFETTERVDCAKPHDLEVFALVDDPAPKGAKYPGRDIMDREANVACPPQFQSYVGIPLDESQLKATFFVPVKATWDANNRRLLCTVSAASGKLTGSVKDSKR